MNFYNLTCVSFTCFNFSSSALGNGVDVDTFLTSNQIPILFPYIIPLFRGSIEVYEQVRFLL